MRTAESKIIDDAAAWMMAHSTMRVVFTNGCFDLLHPGHIDCLQKARSMGSILIVGVNDDDSVRALKGPTRPIMPLLARMTLLAALEAVDAVIPMHDTRNTALLTLLEPDIWVKGGDYTLDTLDAGEVAAARRTGTEIRIIPVTHEYSTTTILAKK